MRILKLFNIDSVSIVGCGGIGSWLIPPLCRFLAAERFEGSVNLWDGDHYEAKNAARQNFLRCDVSRNKAEAMADDLSDSLPKLQLCSLPFFVLAANIDQAVPENGLVITAVDNHPARVLIDRFAQGRNDVAVISAQNAMYDGSAYVYVRGNGEDATQPLLERYPALADIRRGDRAGMGCEDLVEAGETQLLVTNHMAACCAFAAFHMLVTHGERDIRTGKPRIAVPQEIFFDIRTGAMRMDEARALATAGGEEGTSV